TQEFKGVRVIGAPSVRFPLYPDVRLGIAGRGVWRQLDEFAPDLIHLAGPVTTGACGLWYARSRGIPRIASYHTSLASYARLYGLGALEGPIWTLLRSMHNQCSMTLCPSRPVMRELRNHGFQHLHYWSRGVNTHQFSPARRSMAWRQRIDPSETRLILLYVG